MSQFMNVDDIEIIVVLLREISTDEVLGCESRLETRVEVRF